MTKKRLPLGICDHCRAEIPEEIGNYTSKGKPRRYCSRNCQNTANSQAGADIRGQKVKQRMARGEWQNPAKLSPPTGKEQARRARLGRKREVEAGTWRNPALTDEAREKLSRPRKHGDNPALHSAMEKLRQGYRVNQLTPEEQSAHRTYRREQQANMHASWTPEERERQRKKWREYKRKK